MVLGSPVPFFELVKVHYGRAFKSMECMQNYGGIGRPSISKHVTVNTYWVTPIRAVRFVVNCGFYGLLPRKHFFFVSYGQRSFDVLKESPVQSLRNMQDNGKQFVM